MGTHSRSIVKAFSYRVFGTMVTFFIAWLVSGEAQLAAKVGLLDTVFKIAAYYGHERIWNSINFGRPKKPEYEI
jgi:uncharacterized membrane protein